MAWIEINLAQFWNWTIKEKIKGTNFQQPAATDIKHSYLQLYSSRGGRADQSRLFWLAGVQTRQARDLLSLSGTLGFKLAEPL
jgi:hypothetical protein